MYTKFISFLTILLLLYSGFTSLYAEEDNSFNRFMGDNIFDRTLNLAGIYYLSRYPKYLGAFTTALIFLGPNQQPGDAWLMLPPIPYNFFFEESDVGPEGRSRVFFTNVGLIVAGHYTYQWFFKKEAEQSEKTSFQIDPILTPSYQGLALTKTF